MSLWYDRKGNPLSFQTDEEMRAVEALLSDPQYKRVAETTLPDGTWVSTVWLGLDHSFGAKGPPLIFETMVFRSELDLREEACLRYPTEAEALAGHTRVVKDRMAKESREVTA